MKLLLIGATGLVGHEVLTQALANPRIETVVAPARRPLAVTHRKLTAPVVRFDDLPKDADWWQAEAAICTLGTTIGKAGSREAFRQVDHDYPLAVARLARARGTTRFAVVSAKGANRNSPFFYSRVKGEVEADLAALAFPSLTLVRPGLIGGDRAERRAGEHVATLTLKFLSPALPKAWRINPAAKIAEVLLDAALGHQTGTRIIDSTEMA